MEREIKFRAWDKVLKKFLISENHPQGDNSLFWAVAYWLPIMQYTWLKDKNWKEIYESDIVKFKSKNWWNEPEKYIEEIKFNNWQFSPIEIEFDCDDDFYSYKYFDFEIIGNIYETPENLIK